MVKASMTLQKRLAGEVLKCSPKRIVFNPSRLDEISEAITRSDIRGLISSGAVWRVSKKGISRSRANELMRKKVKSQRKGLGSRKGTAKARNNPKQNWIFKVRKQRIFLKILRMKGVLLPADYRKIYNMSKGGYFRSLRHMKLYLNEHGLIKNGN